MSVTHVAVEWDGLKPDWWEDNNLCSSKSVHTTVCELWKMLSFKLLLMGVGLISKELPPLSVCLFSWFSCPLPLPWIPRFSFCMFSLCCRHVAYRVQLLGDRGVRSHAGWFRGCFMGISRAAIWVSPCFYPPSQWPGISATLHFMVDLVVIRHMSTWVLEYSAVYFHASIAVGLLKITAYQGGSCTSLGITNALFEDSELHVVWNQNI